MPDLHRVLKKLVVVVQEAGSDGVPLDEQLCNRLSGGDLITVRTLYKTHGREQPMHGTMIMLMNEMFSSAGNAATKALFCRVKGLEHPVRFKTVDDPEYIPNDPRYGIKDPFLKDRLTTEECRAALLHMLLDLVKDVKHGNDRVIPAPGPRPELHRRDRGGLGPRAGGAPGRSEAAAGYLRVPRAGTPTQRRRRHGGPQRQAADRHLSPGP